ncbi:YpiF family protein [Ureibacillus aquaedulcis]|uniref:YpiF family protein n=1 Tax=Ureibacillus aquaedulcis TaxID=3058421 RepID=A0ABT8GR14_9BACL|nr:YpiF family protein [Ureibacillus sp. BA0131]MDN4493857.1 YpiF family protein [Ureibacillus sp. BA0131]
MFFNVNDVKQFQSQKDFIDTALVPLLSLEFEDERIKQSSSAADFLMSLTAFVEQQFKGRLMLVPPFSYTKQTKAGLPVILLKEELQNAGFKHVIFITNDHAWTSDSEQVDVIWLPSIPLESMDKGVRKTVLEEQLKQIIPILTSKWFQS